MAAAMSMPQRKKHVKSRTGCQCCKARRVKCDEQQPRCGNCKARKVECIYQNHRIVTIEEGGKINIAKGPDLPVSSMYVPTAGVDDSVELKLLHHFSTQTYKSLITPSNNDQDVWQSHLPKIAFGCEYLLHGVYALAAFDLARADKSEHNKWVAIALHYQDQAFKGFRQYLNNDCRGDHEAAMYFSLLVTVLSFASNQVTLIDDVATYYELIRGTGIVLKRNLPFFQKHPLFCNLKTLDQIPHTPITPKVKRVIDLLTEENERSTHANATCQDGSNGTQIYRDGCKQALIWLEKCFATCLDPYYQMYCEAWVPLAGENFFAAIKARDRIALLILICWATLFQRLGEQAWWAKDYGRELADEIVQFFSTEQLLEAKWILEWAQQEINSPS